MRPEVQVLPGPPPVLTSGNAGHRVRSSLARVGVGSRTLTWLPLPVMEPDDHYRGCGILLGVHDRRLLLYAPEQSRPLQPFTSTASRGRRSSTPNAAPARMSYSSTTRQ